MSVPAPKKRRIAVPRPGRAPAVHTPKPFLELAQGDQKVLNQLVRGFERIIKGSLRADPVRGGQATANHVRARFEICEKWFRILRSEYRWGVSRILDTLGEALHAELNGSTFTPDTRACWIPSDGQ